MLARASRSGGRSLAVAAAGVPAAPRVRLIRHPSRPARSLAPRARPLAPRARPPCHAPGHSRPARPLAPRPAARAPHPPGRSRRAHSVATSWRPATRIGRLPAADAALPGPPRLAGPGQAAQRREGDGRPGPTGPTARPGSGLRRVRRPMTTRRVRVHQLTASPVGAVSPGGWGIRATCGRRSPEPTAACSGGLESAAVLVRVGRLVRDVLSRDSRAGRTGARREVREATAAAPLWSLQHRH